MIYLSGRIQSLLSNKRSLLDHLERKDPELYKFLQGDYEEIMKVLKNKGLSNVIDTTSMAWDYIRRSVPKGYAPPVKGSTYTALGHTAGVPGSPVSVRIPDRTVNNKVISPAFPAVQTQGRTIQEYRKYLIDQINRGNKAVIEALKDPYVLKQLEHDINDNYRNNSTTISTTEGQVGKLSRYIPKDLRGGLGQVVMPLEGIQIQDLGSRNAFHKAVQDARDHISYRWGGGTLKRATFTNSTNFQNEESFTRLSYSPYLSPVHYEVVEQKLRPDGMLEVISRNSHGGTKTEIISIQTARSRGHKGPIYDKTFRKYAGMYIGPKAEDMPKNSQGELLVPYLDEQITFGKFKGRALQDIPPYYLAQLDRIPDFMAKHSPSFYMAYTHAMSQHWFTHQGYNERFKSTISEYQGSPMGGTATADRNYYQTDYHFFEQLLRRKGTDKSGNNKWDNPITIQSRERPDIWMDPLIAGSQREIQETVSGYFPRITDYDHRGRLNPGIVMMPIKFSSSNTGKLWNYNVPKQFDPDYHKSQIMRDFWDMIGGLPGTSYDGRSRLYGGFRQKIGGEYLFGGIRGMLDRQMDELYQAKFSYAMRELYKKQFVERIEQHYTPLFEKLYKSYDTQEKMSRGVGFDYSASRQEGEGFVGMRYSSADPLRAVLEEGEEEGDRYWNYSNKDFSRTYDKGAREAWGVTSEPHKKSLKLVEELWQAQNLDELDLIYKGALDKYGSDMELYNEQINKAYNDRSSILGRSQSP